MILTEFLKISENSKNKSVKLYYDVFGQEWGYTIDSPKEFIKESWEKLKNSCQSNANMNGTIFEYLIALCLYSRGILPFYLQATMAFVPNAIYDIALYTRADQPITLSIKSSLRERYKQAGLEGWALKNVHRNSLNYLITLDKTAQQVARKIAKGHVTGLDKIVVATESEFDNLISELATHSYIESKKVTVIEKGILING